MKYICKKLHFQRKPNIKCLASPNFNERPNGVEVNAIIIHYTEINKQETIEHFLNPDSEVSSHYMISKEGEITEFVNPGSRAWHAGVSSWKGVPNLNDNSIGIELVNNGDEAFAEKQYESLIGLIKFLKRKYPIKDNLILGHSDIAPERKIDPGKYFEWERLSKEKIGICIDINLETNNIITKLGDEGEEVLECQKLLNQFGYDIKIDGIFGQKTANVIKAFKTHFARKKIDSNWDNYATQTIVKILNIES